MVFLHGRVLLHLFEALCPFLRSMTSQWNAAACRIMTQSPSESDIAISASVCQNLKEDGTLRPSTKGNDVLMEDVFATVTVHQTRMVQIHQKAGALVLLAAVDP